MLIKRNYFVNEEKGVVVCKLSNIRQDVDEELERHDIGVHPMILDHMLWGISDFVVGKAVCSEEDKAKGLFNEDIGRKIAYRRAQAKLANLKFRLYNRLRRDIQKNAAALMKDTNTLITKYSDMQDNAENALGKVIQEVL